MFKQWFLIEDSEFQMVVHMNLMHIQWLFTKKKRLMMMMMLLIVIGLGCDE